MKEKFQNFFGGLQPKQKAVVVMMMVGVALLLIGLLAYMSSKHKMAAEKAAAPAQPKTPVVMDNNLMAKSQLLEAQKDAEAAKDQLADEQKKIEMQKFGVNGMPVQSGQAGPLMPGQPQMPLMQQQRAPMPAMPAAVRQRSAVPAIPPPPPMTKTIRQSAGMMPPPAAMPPAAAANPIDSEIGGIMMVGGDKKADVKESGKKKVGKRSVYLPISYMEATLLSGLDAPTTSEAKGNPVPVLIRVKTPAVLPNDVKANLRGCFVVADGKGNLATERAELVLVTLSCLDRRGRAVIDQPLTGYIVDADGKAGLRGRVVTKMGAMITRSMIAGMFGGFGDALNNANTTVTTSAIGSLSTIKPEDVGMAGVGKGLSGAFKEIQKFYLDLAHQTMPVVEIGAARPITLVVTKGTSLEIKKIRGEQE